LRRASLLCLTAVIGLNLLYLNVVPPDANSQVVRYGADAGQVRIAADNQGVVYAQQNYVPSCQGQPHTPHFVEGDEPQAMHELMAATLDTVIGEIRRIKADARENGFTKRPRWPMIVLRTPKGWTCPKEIDGRRTEGYWRAHQVPMGEMHENPAHVRILEDWMKSYQPTELFDGNGRLRTELAELAPRGARRMSANPHTNGGLLLRELRLPNFRDYAVDVTAPGAVDAESTRVMGGFLRDVMKLNMDSRNFRLFSPDESNSNRWQDVLEVTNRAWVAEAAIARRRRAYRTGCARFRSLDGPDRGRWGARLKGRAAKSGLAGCHRRPGQFEGSDRGIAQSPR
jgi:hypothetical protein